MENFNFDAEKFIGAEAYDLPGDETEIAARLRDLRCVDGRETRRPDGRGNERLPSTAFPGAGLGFFMDVVGGLRELEKFSRHSPELTMKEVLSVVEEVIGPLSLHTDEHNDKSEGSLMCAGCGYCSFALAEPETFSLREADAHFVRDRLMPDLSRRGTLPTVLKGNHLERGILVVDGDDIGLPSVSSEGVSSFVYHRGLHEKALNKVAEILMERFPERFIGVTASELGSIFMETARRKVELALERLAAGKPRFLVYRNDAKQVLVEPFSEERSRRTDEETEGLGGVTDAVK